MDGKLESKSKSNWNTVYKLASLLFIQDSRPAYGRRDNLGLDTLFSEIETRFNDVVSKEAQFYRLQIGHFLLPTVTKMYASIQKDELNPDDLPILLHDMLLNDEPEVYRMLKISGLTISDLGDLRVDRQFIQQIRGPKAAALDRISGMLGFSDSTLKSKNDLASNTVAFNLAGAPTSSDDLSRIDFILACEILCKIFHLNEKKVEETIEHLFVP